MKNINQEAVTKAKQIEFTHTPVMPEESMEFLNVKKDGIYIDGTLGGGGHSELIARSLSAKGKIIGIDQDLDALKAAKNRLAPFGNSIEYVNDNFANLKLILDRLGIKEVDGILLDLGVSSYQLENPERGFSFSESDENINSRLDMRMDQSQNLTAYDVVNQYPEEQLKRVLQELGEEPFARGIARKIVQVRKEHPVVTTNDLLKIIKSATSPKYRFSRIHGHYASKVFRGIRMEVNQELDAIRKVMPQAIAKLKSGGRLVVISFHSLEDRIVKEFFKQAAKDCICPPDFPECRCGGHRATLKIITKKPIAATEEEIMKNSRSSSAKLRVAEKI